jgi:S1-C subfamily serine protease
VKKLPLLLTGALVLTMPTASRAEEIYDVVKRVRDAVVKIDAEYRSGGSYDGRPQRESGSGILIPDGQILTADQSVQSADWIQITFSNGEMMTARVASSEPQADVAILEIEDAPESIAPAVLGDSSLLQTGDLVFTVHSSSAGAREHCIGRVGAWLKPDTFLELMI